MRRNVAQTNYHPGNTATDLTLPQPKREFLKRSFKFSGAMLWNQLPNETKLAESTSPFKNLKEYSWVLRSCVSFVYFLYDLRKIALVLVVKIATAAI